MSNYVVSFRPSPEVNALLEKLISGGETKTSVLEHAIWLYYLLRHSNVYEKLVFTEINSVVLDKNLANNAKISSVGGALL